MNWQEWAADNDFEITPLVDAAVRRYRVRKPVSTLTDLDRAVLQYAEGEE